MLPSLADFSVVYACLLDNVGSCMQIVVRVFLVREMDLSKKNPIRLSRQTWNKKYIIFSRV